MKTRIISLTFSIFIIVGIIFSLGSCNTSTAPSGGEGGSGGGSISEGTSGSGLPSDNNSALPNFAPDTNDISSIDGLRPEVRALLSTVRIAAKMDIKSSYASGSDSTTERTSHGSGVIYSLDRENGDAYIITNYHVVYNKDEVANGGFSDGISLYLYGMEHEQYAISASVIGGSMTYDIAVLRVEDSEVLKNSMACAAVLGNSENVRVYDRVFAVGNPEGEGLSATEGAVSVESEQLTMIGADSKTSVTLRVMRISAAVNDGNSGGGLYSESGELIGIVNAKRTGSDIDNIGYAIPVNLAKNVADNILANCDANENLSPKKCLIGITLTAKSSGLVADGKGNLIIKEEVEIKEINEGCITDKLLEKDVIKSFAIDGREIEVTRIHHITEAMLTAEVGSSITLTVIRGIETHSITITLPAESLTTVK